MNRLFFPPIDARYLPLGNVTVRQMIPVTTDPSQ